MKPKKCYLFLLIILHPLLTFDYCFCKELPGLLKNDSLKSSSKIYKLNWVADLPVLSGSLGGLYYGLKLRGDKPGVDSATIANLNIQDLRKIDRDATKQKDPNADLISDGIFAGGFLLPLALFADRSARNNKYEIALMYLETMAITGMGYALSVGLTNKLRPYAYNPEFSFGQRTSNNATYSFYAGHPSIVAAGTFFTAKVFSDLHPESKFRCVLWGLAGVSTLTDAYYRYKGGYHFITDLAVGIGVGMATGILVPVLHKKKNNLTIGLKGINQPALIYSFN